MIPNFCLAESYLVELQIKLGNKSGADAQFERACEACGTSDLDREIIRMAYLQNGWDVPRNSACSAQIMSNSAPSIQKKCKGSFCCGHGTEYIDGKCVVTAEGAVDACKKARGRWGHTCERHECA